MADVVILIDFRICKKSDASNFHPFGKLCLTLTNKETKTIIEELTLVVLYNHLLVDPTATE